MSLPDSTRARTAPSLCVSASLREPQSSLSSASPSPDSSHPYSYHPRSASAILTPALLVEGFRLFLQFLLEAEADHLCGATLRQRTPGRVNFRLGCYRRKFRTLHGSFPLRVPHLRYFHPRLPIVKRARRLTPQVLEILARVHATGVTPEAASTLIKTLWTLPLPHPLPPLDHWRNSSTGFQPVGLESSTGIPACAESSPAFQPVGRAMPPAEPPLRSTGFQPVVSSPITHPRLATTAPYTEIFP